MRNPVNVEGTTVSRLAATAHEEPSRRGSRSHIEGRRKRRSNAKLVTVVQLIAFTFACPAAALAGDTQPGFQAMDLWIDSGDEPLAAYQVDIRYDKRTTKIVGIEGGETKAFNAAPHYDTAGMEGGRIVLAAFTTGDVAAPTGRTRVARIHLQLGDGKPPRLSIRLMTAATSGGNRFQPEVEVQDAIEEERE